MRLEGAAVGSRALGKGVGDGDKVLPPRPVLKAIGEGRKPDTMKEDEAIVWEFTTQLRRDHSVDDATYARAMEKFGERGILDLIAVNGYYDVVSMTLNVARVSPPAGETMPFKQAGR